MFDGYLELAGTEVINRERTVAYLKKFLPSLTIKCEDFDGLYRAVRENSQPWDTPQADFAPWYRSVDPHSKEFYGLYPTSISGIDDSTRQVGVTELSGDGAVHSMPRYGSKEIRVRGVMFALSERGMNSGLAWLRQVLEGLTCGYERGPNCGGQEILYFTHNPASGDVGLAVERMFDYGRNMVEVEALDGLRVVGQLNMQKGVAYEVEFILSAGKPWAFTFAEPAVTTTGQTGITWPETYCSPQSDAYDDLVLDPTNPTVSHPPRPPLIETVTMPSQWTRYQMNVPSAYSARHGRMVPIIEVTSTEVERMLRVRFYRENNPTSCHYDGEFLLTYLPANASVIIDGMRRKIEITHEGKTRPAGNLVIGSNGRPPKWPVMSCTDNYRVVVDTVGGLSGARVTVDLALRE